MDNLAVLHMEREYPTQPIKSLGPCLQGPFLCVLENHPLGGWFRISLMAILSDTRNSFE